MDRGKAASKRYFVSDRGGVPLAVVLSAANIRDSKVFEELIDAVEPIALPSMGRPRKRPAKLHADKGYDFPVAERRCATAASRRALPRGVRHTDERLGRYRWVVERTLAWLARYRRFSVRYERLSDIHEAFLHLGCSLICLNYLS